MAALTTGIDRRVYIAIVANGCGYTQGLFWLPWRIILVGRENQIQNLLDDAPPYLTFPQRTPPLLLMPLPKREYKAVSAIADEIRQCRTGGNLRY